MQVPDLESFNELARRVDMIVEENNFLKSLLLGERWLTRNETMKALNCRHDKLRQLTVNNVFTYRYEGKNCLYDVFSLRNYLTAQKIDSKEVDRRLLNARYAA